MNLKEFAFDYQMRLAQVLHAVEKRGVLVDEKRLSALRAWILQELGSEAIKIAKILKRPVAINAEEAKKIAKDLSREDVFNLQSPKQLIEAFKEVGIKVPKDKFTGKETTSEDKLNLLFSETGHPLIGAILQTRELSKILGTNINCELLDNVLFSSYAVTGTISGRRSSRINIFGLGTNHQNIPNHSELGRRFRECIVARIGRILCKCDQVSAEDWIVQGIIADVSGDKSGLESLAKGGRHEALASFIFSKPLAECQGDSPERFLGKKTRHAGNYDMGPDRMAEAMAKENKIIHKDVCAFLLRKFHEFEPNIRNVFHKYVQDELQKTRTLITPFGRERYFFALRPFSDNKKLFKEAYSWIPQSTIGDNTGLAEIYIEREAPGILLLDEHDGCIVEPEDDILSLSETIKILEKAFDRIIRFPNGLEIKIPIEIEIGYDLRNMTKCHDTSETGLQNTLNGLKDQKKVRETIIGGPESQPSVPLCDATSL